MLEVATTSEHYISEQEAFEMAVRGLAAQGWVPSIGATNVDGAGDGDLGCRYRGTDNRKCAVGHLMRDEIYEECFDELDTEYGIAAVARDRDLRPTFLRRLQSPHDASFMSVSTPNDGVMRTRYIELAEREGYIWPEGA